MSNTNVYLVSDDVETVEKVKTYLQSIGVQCHAYGTGPWQSGIENPQFRASLVSGIPALMSGLSPVEGGKVIQFPLNQATEGVGKVSTMNELESKAIENAIMQYRGNLTEAAKALGIGRATLYRKVKQYNIDPSFARRKRAA